MPLKWVMTLRKNTSCFGGFFSGLSGFIGMKIATQASARTTNAARTSLNGGLRVAFSSGAIMGFVVVGLGLLDLSVWYYACPAITMFSAEVLKTSVSQGLGFLWRGIGHEELQADLGGQLAE